MSLGFFLRKKSLILEVLVNTDPRTPKVFREAKSNAFSFFLSTTSIQLVPMAKLKDWVLLGFPTFGQSVTLCRHRERLSSR